MALADRGAGHEDMDDFYSKNARASEGQSSATSTLPALPYRDSFDDDDDDDHDDDDEEDTTDYYFSERWKQRPFVGYVFELLGMSVRKRRTPSTDHDRLCSKDGGLQKGKPRQTSPRDVRRHRRGRTAAIVKRACLALPVVVLMFL